MTAQDEPGTDRPRALTDFEADELTIRVELAEPMFPDEEGDLIEGHIEMNGGIESAEIIDHNAEADSL